MKKYPYRLIVSVNPKKRLLQHLKQKGKSISLLNKNESVLRYVATASNNLIVQLNLKLYQNVNITTSMCLNREWLSDLKYTS